MQHYRQQTDVLQSKQIITLLRPRSKIIEIE